MPVNGEASWLSRPDGDAARMVQTDGLSNRVALMRGFGNAIVAPLAAEFIAAYLDIA